MLTVNTFNNYLLTILSFILLGDLATSKLLCTQRNQISLTLSCKSLMMCFSTLYIYWFISKNKIGLLFFVFQNNTQNQATSNGYYLHSTKKSDFWKNILSCWIKSIAIIKFLWLLIFIECLPTVLKWYGTVSTPGLTGSLLLLVDFYTIELQPLKVWIHHGKCWHNHKRCRLMVLLDDTCY